MANRINPWLMWVAVAFGAIILFGSVHLGWHYAVDGYVGAAGGKITLYRKREPVKHGIPQEKGVEELVNLLKEDGVWAEPQSPARPLEPLRTV